MSDLYRLLDIDSDDPEYGFGNNGTMYRGRVEPVELDYEAAMTLRHRIEWAHRGMGPLVEKYGKATINGVTVGRVSDYDETVHIVNVALGVTDDE